MTKISKEEIKKIASLAKIEVGEDKLEKYSQELSNILGYVEKLQAVTTSNVDGQYLAKNSTISEQRQDIEIADWKVDKDLNKNTDLLLGQSKGKHERYIQVKKVLD